MTPDEYLEKILAQQKFNDSDQEMVDLRERRDEIKNTLVACLGKYRPSIRWAGSKAKGTMIRESYDGDMTCYFARDENGPGDTLEEIHTTVRETLEGDYVVEIKPSALRIYDESDRDLHIDIIPGRYVDDSKSDVFLHRTTGDKKRLKTNLQAHIDHIKDSGVTDAISLMKLWKVLNEITGAKTFVLELLVVKLLKEKKGSPLSEQLKHVWTKFRDEAGSLSVDDPANSNNDLKGILDSCRYQLSSVASDTLWQIENRDWTVVFGDIEEDEDDLSQESRNKEFLNRLKVTSTSVAVPTRPWGSANS